MPDPASPATQSHAAGVKRRAEAVTEIEAVFDRVARDYGLQGPQDGEDERP
jgi:hypothetical protein